MAKRKIHPKELRLVVATEDTKHQGRRMRVDAEMHIARETVNGKLIRGCDGHHYPTTCSAVNYYAYPFGAWLLSNTPRVCRKCAKHTLENIKQSHTQPDDWNAVLEWADPMHRNIAQ